MGAQEENSSLRAERDALRSSGARPEPEPAPARAPADAWAASAPPPRPAADAFSAAQLWGAFEAQRQYLRGRSAGRQALRHAIRRTDDAGIRSQLHSLEEQRARHVRSEWKSLRRIQRLLEGELDTSLALDGEGDFDGGLGSDPLGFDGGFGGRAGQGAAVRRQLLTRPRRAVRRLGCQGCVSRCKPAVTDTAHRVAALYYPLLGCTRRGSVGSLAAPWWQWRRQWRQRSGHR